MADDDFIYLFLQNEKKAQRYVPTGYLPLVIQKALVMMLLSCPLRCHDVSFAPPVDVVPLLAPTPPPLSVSMYTNDRHRHHTPSYRH